MRLWRNGNVPDSCEWGVSQWDGFNLDECDVHGEWQGVLRDGE